MEIIESRIDTSASDYKANYEAMEKMVADLKSELKKAREDRSEKAIKRNAELGKLPVQKRLEKLLDRNSPWLEIAPLAARGLYDGKVHGSGHKGRYWTGKRPRMPHSC